MGVVDSITSFKQLTGGPLTPGSVSGLLKRVTRKKKKKLMMVMDGRRPLRHGCRKAQRDSALKLIAIHFVEIRN